MNPIEIVDQLRERRQKRLTRNWKQYPRTNPIASDLGDCDRAMALGMLAWDLRPTPPPHALEFMESGRVQEDRVLADLRAEGWSIIEEQAPFTLRDSKGRTIMRGRIDGKLVVDAEDGRHEIPLEVKDKGQNQFNRIDTEDDLKSNLWTRKEWRQFQSYLLGNDYEWGIYLLAHRAARKPIVICLDYSAAEEILKRCERAVDVFEALRHESPDRLDSALDALDIAYPEDRLQCQSCDFFRRVCFPAEAAADDSEMVSMPELEDIVARIVELEDAGKEYASLQRKLDALKGKHVHAGSYIVSGRWETQQTKAQPPKPAVPAGTRQVWRRTIARIA